MPDYSLEHPLIQKLQSYDTSISDRFELFIKILHLTFPEFAQKCGIEENFIAYIDGNLYTQEKVNEIAQKITNTYKDVIREQGIYDKNCVFLTEQGVEFVKNHILEQRVTDLENEVFKKPSKN